jgi:hypothetical protein
MCRPRTFVPFAALLFAVAALKLENAKWGKAIEDANIHLE